MMTRRYSISDAVAGFKGAATTATLPAHTESVASAAAATGVEGGMVQGTKGYDCIHRVRVNTGLGNPNPNTHTHTHIHTHTYTYTYTYIYTYTYTYTHTYTHT